MIEGAVITHRSFFETWMQRAIDACKAECQVKEMAESFRPLSSEYGQVGPLYAVGHALLTMEMSSWEPFYLGMVEWKKAQPKYPCPERVEEDARGVMLMALKEQAETYKRLYEKEA